MSVNVYFINNKRVDNNVVSWYNVSCLEGIMAGQIKRTIDAIIQQRAKGDPLLERTTKTKLLLKGINPTRYTEESGDDPAVLEKLRRFADEMGCKL